MLKTIAPSLAGLVRSVEAWVATGTSTGCASSRTRPPTRSLTTSPDISIAFPIQDTSSASFALGTGYFVALTPRGIAEMQLWRSVGVTSCRWVGWIVLQTPPHAADGRCWLSDIDAPSVPAIPRSSLQPGRGGRGAVSILSGPRCAATSSAEVVAQHVCMVEGDA